MIFQKRFSIDPKYLIICFDSSLPCCSWSASPRFPFWCFSMCHFCWPDYHRNLSDATIIWKLDNLFPTLSVILQHSVPHIRKDRTQLLYVLKLDKVSSGLTSCYILVSIALWCQYTSKVCKMACVWLFVFRDFTVAKE